MSPAKVRQGAGQGSGGWDGAAHRELLRGLGQLPHLAVPHLCVGAGEKLVLSELLQPIHPKSTLGSVKKELARVKRKAAVELPLSKEEAKRVSAGSKGGLS